MKKINLYVCEICGTQYKDEPYAKRCEANHKKIDRIGQVRYQSFSDNKPGYPIAVELVMEDGTKLTFKR